MNEIVQYVLAGVIVLAAMVAVVRTVVHTVRGRKTALTACASCQLRDCCQRQEKNSAKKCADKVAQVKKQQ